MIANWNETEEDICVVDSKLPGVQSRLTGCKQNCIQLIRKNMFLPGAYVFRLSPSRMEILEVLLAHVESYARSCNLPLITTVIQSFVAELDLENGTRYGS